MAFKDKRRNADATRTVKAAVRGVLSAGTFTKETFFLPTETGSQISMTGEKLGVGNGGFFNEDTLKKRLRGIPAVWAKSDGSLDRYVRNRRFFIEWGQSDLSLALVGVIGEALEAGLGKLVIAADTPDERDNMGAYLALMGGLLGEVSVTVYQPRDYDAAGRYKSYTDICRYLTSEQPAILLLSRDCFSRKNNVLRIKAGEGEEDAYSLAEYVRTARPAVIAVSETVESGRTLARNADIFCPTVTLVLTEEAVNLHDCVIYKPDGDKATDAPMADAPEQMGF